MNENTIIVSNRQSQNMDGDVSKEVQISNINWVSGIDPSTNIKLQARTRYRQPLQAIKILEITKDRAVIEFEKSQETITQGQSLVIYNGELCLGGGVIC
jgi:tRNA-specific 2-thiouridylase